MNFEEIRAVFQDALRFPTKHLEKAISNRTYYLSQQIP